MTILNRIVHSSVYSKYRLFFIIFLSLIYGCKEETRIKQNTGMDFTQAELMLDFLTEIANAGAPLPRIESILEAEGTQLIIEQMNFVRHVSLDQYEQVLNGLVNGQLPHINPLDSTERSKRGVEGLTNRVWLSLSWAVDNTGILREKMNDLKRFNVYQNAMDLALKYLPEPVEISPALFIVMGGRAGAAAIGNDRIYIDILVMTYSRISQNRPFMKESEFTEFFAHEMHHIGLAKYLNAKFDSLSLDQNRIRLFKMLSSIVAEGSASYLINGHRDAILMRKNLKLSVDGAKENEFLHTLEEIFKKTQTGEIQSEEEYTKENTLMIGQGYHIVGSVMLSIIDQAGGMESVMNTLSDPRLLISEYNKAAQSLSVSGDRQKIYIFNPEIVQKLGLLLK